MTATLACPRAIKKGREIEIGLYIAGLGAYNNGTLHGEWVDLEEIDNIDQLQECIDYILQTSPQPGEEEYAVHDHVGLPGFLVKSEWPNLEELIKWLKVFVYLSPEDQFAYQACCENQQEVLDEETFLELYRGTYDSVEDFCADFYAEQGIDLGPLESYIDWKNVWHGEFDCDGWWAKPSPCGVAIFSQ